NYGQYPHDPHGSPRGVREPELQELLLLLGFRAPGLWLFNNTVRDLQRYLRRVRSRGREARGAEDGQEGDALDAARHAITSARHWHSNSSHDAHFQYGRALNLWRPDPIAHDRIYNIWFRHRHREPDDCDVKPDLRIYQSANVGSRSQQLL